MSDQITRHQCKKIGGFGPRIMPFGPTGALGDRVAVGQEHRQIGLDAHVKGRHHIGAVGVIGDLAKPFGLALGAEHPPRDIQPFERGICLGVDLDLGLPDKGCAGQAVRRDPQPGGREHMIPNAKGHPINRRVDQAQPFTIQPQIAPRPIGVAPKPDRRGDPRVLGRQPKGQRHMIHQIGRRAVIGQMDVLGGGLGNHGSCGVAWADRLGARGARCKPGPLTAAAWLLSDRPWVRMFLFGSSAICG